MGTVMGTCRDGDGMISLIAYLPVSFFTSLSLCQ